MYKATTAYFTRSANTFRCWKSNPAPAVAGEWIWVLCSTPTRVWPSDNTDPFDRLTIQDGFTYAYTPAVMMAWVTDSPNWYNGRQTSLSYRFLSAMQGSLGIGANLNKWTGEDFSTAK